MSSYLVFSFEQLHDLDLRMTNLLKKSAVYYFFFKKLGTPDADERKRAVRNF